MSLTTGHRLGGYEIVAKLGEGGMGQVYRARDVKLGREVAIKTLPDHFASDAERVARFEREAKTLATLNHPHIAQIYGFEQSSLVMELVEGEDLSERIERGPIPVDDALAIARQIADALDAAHGQGIIHRDLKPANVKVRNDGAVKVLDFGLAKPIDPVTALGSGATITSPAMTVHGMILGTAAYMAPEQAKGRPVDKRADIWAFGCIVYEMVTGQRAFAGDDVSETIASVLKTEPDWSRVPARVKPLLASCLQKDLRQRLRDIGDAVLLLDPSQPAQRQPAARSSALAWSVAALAAAAAVGLAVTHFGETPAAVTPIAFDIYAPEGANFGDSYQSLSPDGRRLVYTMRDKAGTVHLWVRDVDRRDPQLLQNTEGARSPFWSPDSRSVAFAVDAKLLRIDVEGGPPRLVSEVANNIGVGSWGPNGTIIFGSRLGGPIYRVADTGGPAVPVTALDSSRTEGFHAIPWLLRDGKRFVYLRNSADPRLQGIFVGSLDLAPDQQPLDMIVQTRLGAGYYAPADGASRLLFVDNGNLMSQELDESRPALVGTPMLEAERVGSAGSYAFFSVSSAGVLAYRAGEAGGPNDINLTWFDRRGQRQSQVLERGAFSAAKLSPDGTRIVGALTRSGLAADIWLSDLARGIMTRLTSDAASDNFPIWAPDSSQILFASFRSTSRGLYEKRVDSAEPERLVWQSEGPAIPDGWSSDGRFVLFTGQAKQTGFDLWLLELGPTPKATPILNSRFDEGFGVFSPDRRHFAYVSDESGRDEVYVRTFAAPGDSSASSARQWRVSNDGGQSPRWRRDGKELLYRSEGRVMSVPIETAGPGLAPGRPVELFSVRGALVTQWDVAADGQRFLIPLLPIGDAAEPIRVTLNWRPGGQQAR